MFVSAKMHDTQKPRELLAVAYAMASASPISQQNQSTTAETSI